MSTETNLDVGLWDRFTDGLSAVSESIVGFLGKLFGSSNERLIRSLGYIRPRGSEGHVVTPGSFLDRVNSLEPIMLELRDDEFEKLTAYFRGRLGVEHKPFVKKGASEIAVVNNGQPAPPLEPTEAFNTLVAQLDQELPAQPTLDDIMPSAYAACREVARRTKNMRHFDT